MSRSTPVQIYRVVKTADNRYDKKEYKKALEGYKRALKMNPNEEIESFCYLKLGLCYQNLNQFNDSILSLDKSASVKKNFEAYFYKGLLFLHLKKLKDSEASFKQCLKLKELTNPQMFLANLNLGRVSFLKQKFKDAIKHLNIALSMNKDDITTILLLAEVNKEIKKFDNAIKLYEHVLGLNIQNIDAIIGILGIFLEFFDDKQKAISYLSSHLKKIKKPNPELHIIKGDIHLELSDYENAVVNYKKARKADPSSEKFLLREIRCLLKLERFDDSISSVTDFLSIKSNKNNFLANLLLAEIYATHKMYEKASSILNELVNTNSEIIQNPELSQAVAKIFLQNNEFEKAEELYLNSMSLGLKNWLTLKQLAIISIEKKDFVKAEGYVDTSFKLANTGFEISQSHHLTALIAFNQEDYGLCIKRCKEGIKEIKSKEDEYKQILQLLEAKCLSRLDESTKTQTLVNSMIELNPDIVKIISQDSDLKKFII